MKQETIDEIKHILPRDRTLFYYFKDRYALMLLEHIYNGNVSIAEVKRSSMAGILNKPIFKALMKNSGNGVLNRNDLQSLWPDSTKVFSLTLSQWGSGEEWDQTTRQESNLVLQLNFSNEHREKYLKMLRPKDEVWINDASHPVRRMYDEGFRRDTLAWARIDLDLDTGEALIEEIQSDFIRQVKFIHDRVEKQGYIQSYYGVGGTAYDVRQYYTNTLGTYLKVWDEAMLAASIDFLTRELGIKDVYYHSWETGIKVKRIGGTPPPKSLYTKLPKRFCFEQTEEVPKFLYKDKSFKRLAKKLGVMSWFKLPSIVH